jgi:MFS family permease
LTHKEQKEEIERLAADYGVNHRKVMAKIDFRLVPAICILYLLAFLDRVNISNAQVYGMSTQLGLTGNEYNTALTIFFVPYVLFEVPSNILLKKFKPHMWLSLCMLLFGAVSIGQGFVKNFSGLLATRFFLGLLETGMFPGCFYLLSMWYRREEAQKRYSFFFSSTCLAGAFGGLIAYGVNHISGKQGIEGWRWIYIIEGAVTMAVALVLFFVISDFPEDAGYLTENERAFINAKLALDFGSSYHDQSSSIWRYLEVFKDWKVWCGGLMYFGLIVPAYGYAYFSTIIIQTFNYSPVQTQLHSIPPWVAAFGFSMILAFISDAVRHRYLFTLFASLITVIGFAILLGNHKNNHARYAACHLVATGAYTAMPLIVCWTNLNFSGHYRRAVGSGWQIGFGNIGGIIATYSFLADGKPFYTKGLSICVGFTCLSILATFAYFVGVWLENRAKRSGKRDAWFQALSPEDQALAGDLRPSFLYSY